MEYKLLLNELLTTLKLSKKKFAEGLNLSQGNVSDWFNRPGYRPSIDALKRISDTYNVNLNWLVTGQGDMFNKVPARARPDRFVHIPVVADIAAGAGIEAYDVEPSEHITLHQSLLTLPGPYLAFKVDGISMAPYIFTGDLAIVTQSWHDLDLQDRVLAFRTIDGLTLKRFYLDPRRKYALLIPYNPTYPVLKFTETDPDYTVLGLLLLVLRRF